MTNQIDRLVNLLRYEGLRVNRRVNTILDEEGILIARITLLPGGLIKARLENGFDIESNNLTIIASTIAKKTPDGRPLRDMREAGLRRFEARTQRPH